MIPFISPSFENSAFWAALRRTTYIHVIFEYFYVLNAGFCGNFVIRAESIVKLRVARSRTIHGHLSHAVTVVLCNKWHKCRDIWIYSLLVYCRVCCYICA